MYFGFKCYGVQKPCSLKGHLPQGGPPLAHPPGHHARSGAIPRGFEGLGFRVYGSGSGYYDFFVEVV